MLTAVATTLALTLSTQLGAPADEALALNQLDTRPSAEEIVPANGLLFVAPTFHDAGLQLDGTVDGQDITIERTCTFDSTSCIHRATLTGLVQGETRDISVTGDVVEEAFVTVTVGPEDNDPPGTIETEGTELVVFVDSDDAIDSFSLRLPLRSTVADDVAMLEIVEIEEDDSHTPRAYRLIPAGGAAPGTINIALSQLDGEVCLGVNAYDLAGNKTLTTSDGLCRTLSREDADEEIELLETVNVGCSHMGDATPSGVPAGLAVLLCGGLVALRRRRA